MGRPSPPFLNLPSLIPPILLSHPVSLSLFLTLSLSHSVPFSPSPSLTLSLSNSLNLFLFPCFFICRFKWSLVIVFRQILHSTFLCLPMFNSQYIFHFNF